MGGKRISSGEDEGSRLALVRRDHVDAPGHDAHAAWAGSGWPSVAAAFASRPIGAFYSHAVSVTVGPITVQFASGSARALERSAEQAGADGFDLLVAGINFDGESTGTAGKRAVVAGPGALLLFDLSQPCRLTIPASRSMQLAIPRPVAEQYLGPVRRLHGRVASAETAALLVDHLAQLERAMPTLAASQGPRLAGVILDLLAIAIRRDVGGARDGQARGPDDRRPAAIRAAVEATVTEPWVTVAALCGQLGISRSTLTRLFREEGGVEAHLRNLRLDRVREALMDDRGEVRIGHLAEQWGFSDASHLSRAFRARYGVTPTAMRAGRETAADAVAR